MKSVVLIVLDGFGMAPPSPGNAIDLAKPANITSWLHSYPNTTLRASGEAVGLPQGEAGNTEVGHINLGAGRVVFQDLPRINMSIADGSFYENAALLKTIAHVKQTGGKLHIIGLIGQGSVHSHLDHLYALTHLAKEQGIQKLFIHAITDGRDSPPKSAETILQTVEERLNASGICCFASVMGRYWGMDRDRRWDRIEKAYNCLTKGSTQVKSIHEAIQAAYAQGKTDEFIDPVNITQPDGTVPLITKGDAVIFFNYRIDRPRELTKAFVLNDFENTANQTSSFDPYEVKYYHSHIHAQEQQAAVQYPTFKRGEKIENLMFVTMTEYEKGLPVEVAFPKITVKVPLGRVLADHDCAQLRMAESEKERFVTYYFNGQQDMPFPQESRLIIASPHVATYDLKPEMSARELTDALIHHMAEQKHSFTLINFANSDMVGHTGNLQAAVQAIKVLDECLAKIVTHALTTETTVLITADHGNAEQMINPDTGQIKTEHTSNPVPFIAISKALQGKFMKLQTGILADVAPTVLALLGVPKPSDMTGRNLLEEVRL